jgi:hypothetical protein
MENISYQNVKNADVISTLPTDKNEPSPSELQVVNTLFSTHKKDINCLLKEAKESLIVGIIFVIFTLPYTDTLIQKFIPITLTSCYILLLIKILGVMCVFWLVKHFYLSRNSSS